MTPSAITLLCTLPWPGNVAELNNVLERAALRCDGVIDRDLMRMVIDDAVGAEKDAPPDSGFATLKELECLHIKSVLKATPTVAAAARVLGISRSAIYRKMEAYGIRKGGA